LRQGAPKVLLAVAGGLVAFFIASYTGVLLSVTNRPIWADTSLLGLLFLVSAASTAAALLLLLGRRQITPASVGWLKQMDKWALLFELLVLLAVVISLGAVAQAWLSVWGILLLVGVVLVGNLLPLALHWRPGLLGGMSTPAAAVLVLIGGFILRAVIVLSSEGLEEVTAWLLR
ncbi:MAG: NrfD/PsrC family molybdoenzyme membrane anchor subunit, partial [Ardenticatenaceae bacterium]